MDERCVLYNVPLVQLLLLAPRVWSKASEALLLARTNALVQLVDPANNDFAHLNAVQLRSVPRAMPCPALCALSCD